MAIAMIELVFSIGSEIEECFAEADRIANKLDVICKFEFNRVKCFARPLGSIKKGLEEYLLCTDNKKLNKLAVT